MIQSYKYLVKPLILLFILSIQQDTPARNKYQKKRQTPTNSKQKKTNKENWKLYLLPIGACLSIAVLIHLYKPKSRKNTDTNPITTNKENTPSQTAFSQKNATSLKNKNPSGKSNSKKPTKTYSPPCGLANLGNTCFINAIIQCLAHLSDIKAYVQSGEYKNDLNEYTDSSITLAFFHLLKQMYSSQQAYIAPIEFINTIQNNTKFASPSYKKNKQYDAYEFLAYLLAHLHQSIKERKNSVLKKTIEKKYSYYNLAELRYTFISEIKYGVRMERTKCRTCNNLNPMPDFFTDLNLLIPALSDEKNSITLEKCIECYFLPSNLDEKSEYICQDCGALGTSTQKILSFKIAPKLLIIRLKREVSQSSFKKETLVTYPIVLNIGKKFAHQIYYLISVVNHLGKTLYSGHYTAYSKSNDQWYEFDDRKVSKTDTDSVVTKNAYILFYKAKN